MRRAWYLVADIGGTNARFCLVCPDSGARLLQERLSVDAHDGIGDALKAFLAVVAAQEDWQPFPRAACLAVAAPVTDDVVNMTNAAWRIDRRACADCLGLDDLLLVNDFEAVGYALATLGDDDLEALDAAQPLAEGPRVVLGAGTGLGVCCVVRGPSGDIVIPGEGGHVDLPAATQEEYDVVRFLAAHYGHVSAERLLSGSGLSALYAFCASTGIDEAPDAAAITAAALAGRDAVAVRTVELFCRWLGAVAGNAALTLGARGGVFLAGGIAPRLLPVLRRGGYRERFVDKGRYRGYLEEIPTRVIVHDDPGLLGAVNCLRGGP